jgi:hypothetical protein
MKETILNIRRGITDNCSRELIINEHYLSFEDKDTVNNNLTTFYKNEIDAYRFGIKWTTFYFTFGREYQIFIKNKVGKEIKINFKTYCGNKKHEYHSKYQEILDSLWDNYFSEIINNYIEKHNKGEDFQIEDVVFTKDYISLKVDNLVKQKEIKILWNDIRTKNYQTYFAIYSITNPKDLNKAFSYLDDWNTGIIYSVLRTILRDKNIESYNSNQ